jgi:hypothetical protein
MTTKRQLFLGAIVALIVVIPLTFLIIRATEYERKPMPTPVVKQEIWSEVKFLLKDGEVVMFVKGPE